VPALKAQEAQYSLIGPIHDSLQALVHGVEQQLGAIVNRASDIEYQLRETLASVTLIERIDAAKLLKLSESQLDRKIKEGEIEVTYLDARPRVRLTELERYIAVNTKAAKFGRRRRLKKKED
jgi:hypothetical protein